MITTMSVQVETRVNSCSGCRLMSNRAEKSASIHMPNTTSSDSMILLRGTNDVATMNRTVAISSANKA